MRDRFKIITTLGPASSSIETIKELLPLSSAFRLNSSHLNPNELEKWLNKLYRIFDESGSTIPVIIDLQGAKMRIGNIRAVSKLPEKVRLTLAETNRIGTSGIDYSCATNAYLTTCRFRTFQKSNAVSDQTTNRPEQQQLTANKQTLSIPVPHSRLFRFTRPGETLLLNDGKVKLEVITVFKHEIIARVKINGPLSSNKGINRRKHPVPFEEVSPRDSTFIQIGNQFPFTSFALSFVTNHRDCQLVRAITDKKITAKIERPESFNNLSSIAKVSDSLWLCRGDLGAQAGLRQMAKLQNDFETFMLQRFSDNNSQDNKANKGKTEFFLAGQVFEHLTSSLQPTRSEVVHFYNILQMPYSGIVLSDETAIGTDPVNTVKEIRELLWN